MCLVRTSGGKAKTWKTVGTVERKRGKNTDNGSRAKVLAEFMERIGVINVVADQR